MADDNAAENRRNAQLAQDARMREIAREEIAESRCAMWDRLGHNIRSDAGVERIRHHLGGLEAIGIDPTDRNEVERWRGIIAWIGAAYDASVTRNKRILGWITTIISIAGGLIAIAKFYIDWGHK